MDWGGKRIGLAVAETGAGIATARTAVAASGSLERDAEAIAELARREMADLIVVGVPVEFAEASRSAKLCLSLAERLRARGLSVETQDEDRSSVQAEEGLAEAKLSRARLKKALDSAAARVILERFLESHAQKS